LKSAWDELDSNTKQLVTWAFLAVLVFGAFGLSCANLMPAFPCTWPEGLFQALTTFAVSVAVSQGVHKLSRKKG
jgi:hypothetical protein